MESHYRQQPPGIPKAPSVPVNLAHKARILPRPLGHPQLTRPTKFNSGIVLETRAAGLAGGAASSA